jgi:hypothetical protein
MFSFLYYIRARAKNDKRFYRFPIALATITQLSLWGSWALLTPRLPVFLPLIFSPLWAAIAALTTWWLLLTK